MNSSASGSSKTIPSLQADPDRKPKGVPEQGPKNPKTPEEHREVEDKVLQNRSANVLAQAGYDIEYRHNKPITIEETSVNPRLKIGRRPDYLIDGKVFDHLAPQKGTSVRSIITRNIKRDKIDQGQATRFILNLDRSEVTIDQLQEQLTKYPVEGLDEIIVVRGVQVIGLTHHCFRTFSR
jgi:hypothetical protein